MDTILKKMDFTLYTYQLMLESLKQSGNVFVPFADYITKRNLMLSPEVVGNNQQINNSIYPDLPYQICILRHDVDRSPQNSLETAKIEYEMGIKGSYYFRIVSESFNKNILRDIADLGHEVGYHYEDMDLVRKKIKIERKKLSKDELVDLAYESFCENLEKMNKISEIKTICMHGSPLSKYDNKLIWTKYNYKKLGIIGEPYFDIDWNYFAYFTDTGRKWNSTDSSVRDKVESKYKFNFKSTKAIIDNIDKLPKNIMITIHPQRWNNNLLPWINELLFQNAKNLIKKYFLVKNNNTSV